MIRVGYHKFSLEIRFYFDKFIIPTIKKEISRFFIYIASLIVYYPYYIMPVTMESLETRKISLLGRFRCYHEGFPAGSLFFSGCDTIPLQKRSVFKDFKVHKTLLRNIIYIFIVIAGNKPLCHISLKRLLYFMMMVGWLVDF